MVPISSHWTQAVVSGNWRQTVIFEPETGCLEILTRDLAPDPEDRRLANVTSRITAIADVDEIDTVRRNPPYTPFTARYLPVVSRQPQWAPSERIEKATPQLSRGVCVPSPLNDVAFGDPQTVDTERFAAT